jgi:hypothetical protein
VHNFFILLIKLTCKTMKMFLLIKVASEGGERKTRPFGISFPKFYGSIFTFDFFIVEQLKEFCMSGAGWHGYPLLSNASHFNNENSNSKSHPSSVLF